MKAEKTVLKEQNDKMKNNVNNVLINNANPSPAINEKPGSSNIIQVGSQNLRPITARRSQSKGNSNIDQRKAFFLAIF